MAGRSCGNSTGIDYEVMGREPFRLCGLEAYGAILENYTVSEIRKTWLNNAKECLMHYYRDKDTNEIDLVIESDGGLNPLEIKKSTNPGAGLASAFKILDKGSMPRGNGAILCLRETMTAVDRNTFIVPIWMI